MRYTFSSPMFVGIIPDFKTFWSNFFRFVFLNAGTKSTYVYCPSHLHISPSVLALEQIIRQLTALSPNTVILKCYPKLFFLSYNARPSHRKYTNKSKIFSQNVDGTLKKTISIVCIKHQEYKLKQNVYSHLLGFSQRTILLILLKYFVSSYLLFGQE